MLKRSRRLPYPSDLSDKEWKLIKPSFPNLRTNIGKKRIHSYREILNAIFYLLRSGCAWRVLTHEFSHWKTVYHYFLLWRLEGIWERRNITPLKIEFGIKVALTHPAASNGVCSCQLSGCNHQMKHSHGRGPEFEFQRTHFLNYSCSLILSAY